MPLSNSPGLPLNRSSRLSVGNVSTSSIGSKIDTLDTARGHRYASESQKIDAIPEEPDESKKDDPNPNPPRKNSADTVIPFVPSV
jgi:hypothetical protein